MSINVGDFKTPVDGWLETTRNWQGNLDKASKYWCFGLAGTAQSMMGLIQVIAGVALAIFPGTDCVALVRDSRLQGLELAQKGILNIFGGVMEAIPVVGTIVAIARIMIAEKEDRAKAGSKELLNALVASEWNLLEANRKFEEMIRNQQRDLDFLEAQVASECELKKREIATSIANPKTVPTSMRILLNDSRSSADIIRQDGIEAVQLEIQFMKEYTKQQERSKIIHSMDVKKKFSNEEKSAIMNYGIIREKFMYLFQSQQVNAASIGILLADKRSATKIMQKDGLDALKLRIDFMNRCIQKKTLCT